MKTIRTFFVIIFALSALVFTAGLANAAPATPSEAGWHHSRCSSGTLSSGSYRSLTITGSCTVPDGAKVTVNGPVTLRAGATFNAMTASTVRLNGNVIVGRGATFAFGCSFALTLPEFPGGPSLCSGVSDSRINGNIVASAPRTLQIDGATIHGNIVSIGGGKRVTGANPASCEQTPGALNFPIKDNTIHGNMVISGWTGCWLGVIRNVQRGSTVLLGNKTADTDSTEVVTNTIKGNLVCFANFPAPQVGDSQGQLNSVTGAKVGQCRTV